MVMGLLLMAAGKSKRFKATSHGIHKLLYQNDAQSACILEKTYAKARGVFDSQAIYVVVNKLEHEVVQCAKQMGSPLLIVDSDGIGESISQAVTVCQNCSALLILHADLPLIQEATIQSVCDALQYSVIARPIYENQQGHPVGFQQQVYPQLMKLSADQGANHILKHYAVTSIPVKDRGTVQDIDTLNDALTYLKIHENT